MDIKEILNLGFDSLVEEFKNITGISANGLAKALNISPTQISQIRKGTYNDVDGTEEKARTYIKLELEKYSQVKFEHKKIAFNFIGQASGKIRTSVNKNKIVLLRGDSGSGKTTLLKAFAKEYPNHIFIQAYKGMKKSELIKLISESKETALTHIIPRVKGKILILDEANKLSGGTLEWLRSLYDKSNMPMIWAGTYEDINDVLYKQPELNRRCRKVYMRNLDDKELAILVDSFEFKNSKEYTKLLKQHFNGQLGLCVEVLKELKDLVLDKGDKVDNIDSFKEIIELME
ncbi:MAG: AAA family ATPase [Candidatus Paceibacteria bacterium]